MLLKNLTDILSQRANRTHIKKLISDTATLQEWQAAACPTHKQRDAMMKLGSDWHVAQKENGKKRVPIEVAKNLEKEFIAAAQRILADATPFAIKRGAEKTTQDEASSKRRTCATCAEKPSKETLQLPQAAHAYKDDDATKEIIQDMTRFRGLPV